MTTYTLNISTQATTIAKVYLKTEVDEAIAELKAENERLKERSQWHRQKDKVLHGQSNKLFYSKSEADKVIAEITEGAISMFRCSETCRGLDLKSPLGKIANIAFKHWNSVEFIQNENTQLQKDKERLLQNNHHLLGEIERLKEKMERRERHHKYKRCLDKACRCKSEYVHRKSLSDKEQWYWRRWYKKWLELAEKFKDGK